jgi:NAD+ kinase
MCEQYQVPYFLPAYIAQSGQDFYQHIDASHLRPHMDIFDNIDVAMVLGGDGTILKQANQFASYGVSRVRRESGFPGFSLRSGNAYI